MSRILRGTFAFLALAISVALARNARADDPAADVVPAAPEVAAKPVDFAREIQPILEQHCIKCHGAKRSEAGLRLDARAEALAGGDDGPVITPGKAATSRLIARVAGTADQGRMPPEDEAPALAPATVALLRAWIDQGAKWAENPADDDANPGVSDHWAFQPLRRPAVPTARADHPDDSPIDAFVADALAGQKLAMSPEASRPALIRRVSLDVLGLPPPPAEVEAFVRDEGADAYERLVERLLASPHYGERMGRHWLDVVGYSDSNGYHRNDTPRPLAWRYRDYVVKSLNDDKPYDRFWLEQLAGDELVGPRDRSQLPPDAIDCLVATHFLRNGPDGTDSTEGNEIARTIERYAVLEQQQQITVSAMFALTIDCARCHSHKFDPIPQRDYYALQAVFYPAFNVKRWVQPKDRSISVASPRQRAQWQAQVTAFDAELAAMRQEQASWRRANRQKGTVLFSDDFEMASLAPRWSNTAPGDDTPAAAVNVDSTQAPAAHAKDGTLAIVEAGSQADGWLCTSERFDWTPQNAGQWIQVTFDLVDVKVDPAGSPAERVGYYIALHDYNDNDSVAGGDILIDGNPAGGAEAHVDYPGARSREAGKIGASPYVAGRNYGVRVTNVDGKKFRLQQVVDGTPEEKSLPLDAKDLPDGGIGFEYCCGRSFVVDNVLVESGDLTADDPEEMARRERVKEKQKEFDATLKKKQAERPMEPGLVAWITDLSPKAPEVHLLKRGSYFNPGPEVAPAALSVLSGDDEKLEIPAPGDEAATTGRRLAFARWATRRGSRAAALLARVQANRMWMWRFGRGIVDTPENFGTKGAAPTHPELLEYLAAELADHNGSLKRLDRQILLSRAYRQGSGEAAAIEADPEDRYLWRYPPRRMDSETIRDSMLAVSGTLNLAAGGPPIDYKNDGDGQMVVTAKTSAATDAANRRSIYIRQRRSEPVTFLSVFDQATAEPNCPRRSAATVVSQSLALLNSEFVVTTADAFATRIEREGGGAAKDRVRHAFALAFARPPSDRESDRILAFLRTQEDLHRSADTSAAGQAAHLALANFCQMLLAANEFIYIP